MTTLDSRKPSAETDLILRRERIERSKQTVTSRFVDLTDRPTCVYCDMPTFDDTEIDPINGLPACPICVHAVGQLPGEPFEQRKARILNIVDPKRATRR